MSDLEKTQKDISANAQPQNILKDRDLFNSNVLLMYAVKKTERLASAVHLLSGSWHAQEPLRTQLRLVSLELLSELMLYGSAQGRDGITRILSKITETLSLLSVAASAKLITVDNVEVVEIEYRKLAGLILERFPELGGLSLASAFFDTGGVPGTTEGEVRPYLSAHRYRGEPATLSRRSASGTAPAAHGRTPQVPGGRGEGSLRRDQVLSVIDAKGKVTIKDVASVISDCSEKTIQRELALLVSDGVVKREGERRWSTYQRA